MKKAIIAAFFALVLIQSVFAAQVFVSEYTADSSTEKTFTLPGDYPDFLRGTLSIQSQGAYSITVNGIFIGSKDTASNDVYSVVFQGGENKVVVTSSQPTTFKVDISDKSRISADAVYCTTLNTGFVGEEHGIIGCDVNVLGLPNIDLSKSYCVGERANRKFFLHPDDYGRPDRYYATLGDLGYDERVRVVIASTDGTEYVCSPDLNTREVDTSCPSKEKLSSNVRSCLSQGKRYDMFVDNTDCRRVRCLGVNAGYDAYVAPQPIQAVVNPAPQQSVCTDSDDINFNTKGTLTITGNQNPNFPLGYFSGSDYCVLYNQTQAGNNYRVDSCGSTPANNCQVKEYYCAGDTSVGLTIDNCPYGCVNGACLTQPTSVEPITCFDTDGGINIYEKGQLMGNGVVWKTNIDYCMESSSMVLFENDCGWDNGVVGSHHNGFGGSTQFCPYGCRAGACLPQSTDSTYQPPVQPTTAQNAQQDQNTQQADVQPIPTQTQPVPTQVQQPIQQRPICGGCEVGDACLPIGTRNSGQFCDVDQSMQFFKSDNFVCSNNFECSSNLCIDNQCVSGSMWQKFLSWFTTIFGAEKQDIIFVHIPEEPVITQEPVVENTSNTCPSQREIEAQFEKCAEKGVVGIKKENHLGCIVVECIHENNASERSNRSPQSE